MDDFIPYSRPEIGDEERAAVDQVLRSGWLIVEGEFSNCKRSLLRAWGPQVYRENYGCQAETYLNTEQFDERAISLLLYPSKGLQRWSA